MNKKIFTLLAGAFLMLATVFSASAQSAISAMPLRLGDAVGELQIGANDYYHLRVEAVLDASAARIPTLLDSTVLYMGNQQTDRSYPIFLAPLGKAGATTSPWISSGVNTLDWFTAGAPRTQESASSLWCTVIHPHVQGQNITFDFTNKFVKDQLLEIEAEQDDYYTWGVDGSGYQVSGAAGSFDTFVPGIISKWHFSETYTPSVKQGKPMFAYVIGTSDTVVVLCAADPTAPLGEIVLKIAGVNDVLNERVPGMLFFTLYEAMPFTLDAADFNSMFGTKTTPSRSKLIFSDNDVTTGNTNPFSGVGYPNSYTGLYAEHLFGAAAYVPTNFNPTDIYDITSGGPAYDASDAPIENLGGHTYYTFATGIPAGAGITNFDQLGYMYLRNVATTAANLNTASYLYVKQDYHNLGNDQFLTFDFRKIEESTATSTPDEIWADQALYGQTIWRLVYYPSGDSIYINSYQATYLPISNPAQMKRSMSSTLNPGVQVNWMDELAQSSDFYTFRATLDNLELPATPTAYDYMTARLKYGIKPVSAFNAPAEYRYYHKNYVTIQDLSGPRIVTLGYGASPDHKIDRRIHFDIYSPCIVGNRPGDTRATLTPDLYLIRNEAGQYLHIPFNSATDSAVWSYLDEDVRPEFMPSYQWIIEKRSVNSDYSTVSFINREFDGTRFNDIQLRTNMSVFDFTGGEVWKWNSGIKVNSRVVTFAQRESSATNRTATFIRLAAEHKKDKFMGYTHIDHDEALINSYALKFGFGGDWGRYVSWDGDIELYPNNLNNDTTIYIKATANSTDKLFFNIDTVKINRTNTIHYALEGYGYVPKVKGAANFIEDLVQLERRPYVFYYADKYKLLCDSSITITNATDYNEYAIGDYRFTPLSEYFGQPMFNLRNSYFKPDPANPGKYIPYFALAQVVNENSISSTYGNDHISFKAYLDYEYGTVLGGTINTPIIVNRGHTNNSYHQTGVFVAQWDDQMMKLEWMLRADAPSRLSTFAIELDEDPIYRRFNDIRDDGAVAADRDAPKVLNFYEADRRQNQLFENTGFWRYQQDVWADYGLGKNVVSGRKNYLGLINTDQYPLAETAIYVDTAFIQRGSGPIKPQYLLLVDPKFGGEIEDCDEDGNIILKSMDYLRGRYLINATDSARGVGSGAAWNTFKELSINGVVVDEYDGRNYLWDTNWERLVFTDALHSYSRDALYIANWPGVSLDQYLSDKNPSVIDVDKLEAASAAYNAATSSTKPIRKIFLGNNDHKDVVFSMRFFERDSKEFIIESETGKTENPVTNRIWGTSYGRVNSNGPIIAPCYGGWLKYQDGTMVISRSDAVFSPGQGMRFDTSVATTDPVNNEQVAVAAPIVIGDENAVVILNAAGKKVVISNILGQTVANLVISSDNAVIAAPKGVVIVAIEGETSVKALVK